MSGSLLFAYRVARFHLRPRLSLAKQRDRFEGMELERETYENVDREFGAQPPEKQEKAPWLEAVPRPGQSEIRRP